MSELLPCPITCPNCGDVAIWHIPEPVGNPWWMCNVCLCKWDATKTSHRAPDRAQVQPVAWREYRGATGGYLYREVRAHLAHPESGEPLYSAPPDLLSAEEALSFMGFEQEPIPPKGHPLQILGARLAELLDADKWNNLEPLMLEAWKSFGVDTSYAAQPQPAQVEAVAWQYRVFDLTMNVWSEWRVWPHAVPPKWDNTEVRPLCLAAPSAAAPEQAEKERGA